MQAHKKRAVKPLHQRILGRSQVELDDLEDLTAELEKAYTLDLIEYDQYLVCHDALTVRRERALVGVAKAAGYYVKPQAVKPQTKARPVQAHSSAKVKFLCVVVFLVLFFLFK